MNTKQNFIIFSSILALAIAFIYQNTSFAQLGTDPRILTVRQGGTGTSTVTTGAVIYGNGTGAFLSIGPCSDGQPLEWSSSLPTCGTDATGAGGDYPFTPQIIGGTEHSASTTRPFYFSQGLLTSSSTMGFLNVGFLNATSSTASTFTVAPIFSSLTGVLKGNGASALTIAVDGTDFSLITALTCSGTDKFSAVTADGTFTCTADSTGSGGGPVNPFDFITIGGTSHAASSTRPFYFGQGLLAASSTLGYLNVGYINATSSTASTFAGGVTITCTDCVTDANVADLAVGGDVTGTLSAIAVTDDSHAHTGATISGLDISGDTNLTAGIGITLTDDDLSIDTSQNIATLSNLTSNGFVKTGGGVGTLSVDTSTYLTTVDISANTNLAATFPIVLTGDTLSFGWAYPFIGNATSSVLTFSSAPIFSSLTGVLKGNGASALSVAVDGTDFSLITALTCAGNDKFSAVTADGTFTCSTDQTGGAGGSNPFSSLTVGGTVYQATTSPLYFSGGFLTGTSTIGTLTATSTITGLNGLTISGGSVNFPDGSIANADLANSTITFGNGTCATGSGSTALGGTGTVSVTSNCTDAATVDSIEGASLLRSDASDNYTSGTLTFDSGTTLTMAAGSTFGSSITGTSTWAGALGTAGLSSSNGFTITGGAFRLNSESFTDLTGTGLDNTAGVLTPNCAAITGSAALCDGDDATGGGASFSYPFTMLTNYGTTTNATTTPFWFLGPMYASSTATSTFVGPLQGGKQTLVQFAATANEPPASTFATFDTRNNHAILDFDDTLNEIAYFTGTMPQSYSRRAVSVVIKYAMTSATANTVQWDISFERLLVGTDNLDTNSFGATSTATVTVPGTAGIIGMASINVTAGTNMDNIVEGDLFRLNVTRNGAADSGAGDAELISVIIKEE